MACATFPSQQKDFVFEVVVLKCEFRLDPLAPSRVTLLVKMIIEIDVRAMLIFLCRHFRLLVPLEPCAILLVVPPAASLKFT